jgi:hypothetical protein
MRFLVLIRAPDEPCRQIYGKLGKAVRIAGKPFVLLTCDELVSASHYAQVRLLEPPNKRGLLLWIPHSVVVAVYSGDSPAKIGFGDA